MKILHTSDWHLGRSLYGRKRYAEFSAFLDWLAETIERERVEALLVAGDVFDTGTPGNRAQALYYRFLCRVAASPCRHVVVIAGNHDSPTFLEAPAALLRTLDVHVIGSTEDDPAREVLQLKDPQGVTELIVCAVPYLRDRDIRTAEAGESVETKEQKLLQGVRDHYATVTALAEAQRAALERPVPLVVMGHLFTAGGQTMEGDGVRELYVGSLAHVTAGIFPETIDYLALGHLHLPQRVQGRETRRYSGAPLPMGFGEARQAKSVCRVVFAGDGTKVEQLPVPCFQDLERIEGDWETITGRLSQLAAEGSRAWLEIVYDGDEIAGDLRERLVAAVQGTELEILRVKNDRVIGRALEQGREQETLDDLDEEEVFQRCLQAHDIPQAQQPALVAAYRETLRSLREEDSRAE